MRRICEISSDNHQILFKVSWIGAFRRRAPRNSQVDQLQWMAGTVWEGASGDWTPRKPTRVIRSLSTRSLLSFGFETLVQSPRNECYCIWRFNHLRRRGWTPCCLVPDFHSVVPYGMCILLLYRTEEWDIDQKYDVPLWSGNDTRIHRQIAGPISLRK